MIPKIVRLLLCRWHLTGASCPSDRGSKSPLPLFYTAIVVLEPENGDRARKLLHVGHRPHSCFPSIPYRENATIETVETVSFHHIGLPWPSSSTSACGYWSPTNQLLSYTNISQENNLVKKKKSFKAMVCSVCDPTYNCKSRQEPT